jgi:hypothetical protein
MASDRYLPFLPTILNWIQQTLDAHAAEMRHVASFGFPRLPHYFRRNCWTAPTSFPPTASLYRRSPRSAFESLRTSRINRSAESHYRDTYFLQRDAAATDESLHFHELVHVGQWQVLGPRDFLLLCTLLVWPNVDTVKVRSKRWPSSIKSDSIPGSSHIRWKRRYGGRLLR